MRHQPLDKASIVVATLCALHCLLVPVVLPMLTLVGLSFLGFEIFERIILAISLLVGGIAVILGMRHHASWSPIWILLLGGVLYINKNLLGHAMEPVLVVSGAAFIVLAHVLNLRLCRTRNQNKSCEQVEAEHHGAESHSASASHK